MSFGAYLTTFGTGTMAKLLLSIQLPNDKLMKIGSNKSSKIPQTTNLKWVDLQLSPQNLFNTLGKTINFFQKVTSNQDLIFKTQTSSRFNNSLYRRKETLKLTTTIIHSDWLHADLRQRLLRWLPVLTCLDLLANWNHRLQNSHLIVEALLTNLHWSQPETATVRGIRKTTKDQRLFVNQEILRVHLKHLL